MDNLIGFAETDYINKKTPSEEMGQSQHLPRVTPFSFLINRNCNVMSTSNERHSVINKMSTCDIFIM